MTERFCFALMRGFGHLQALVPSFLCLVYGPAVEDKWPFMMPTELPIAGVSLNGSKWHVTCSCLLMKNKRGILSLTDMDIGSFVNYELSAGALTTKLFRVFTLNTIPLNRVLVFREAGEEDITPLNRMNWFSCFRRRSLCPVYTLQATEKSPRIFMRLDRGTYVVMQTALQQLHQS